MTDWLATFGAFAVATISLVFSVAFGLSSRLAARRALALAEQQEARRRPRLDLSIVESCSWRVEGSPRRVGCCLLISNPTDTQNTLVGADLRVTYEVRSVLTTVKVTPGSDVEAFSHIEPASLPIRLTASSAVVKWFLFVLDDDLTGGSPIERYDIAVRDVHGVEESIQLATFREILDDEAS